MTDGELREQFLQLGPLDRKIAETLGKTALPSAGVHRATKHFKK